LPSDSPRAVADITRAAIAIAINIPSLPSFSLLLRNQLPHQIGGGIVSHKFPIFLDTLIHWAVSHRIIGAFMVIVYVSVHFLPLISLYASQHIRKAIAKAMAM